MESLKLRVIELNLLLEHISDKISRRNNEAKQNVLSDLKKEELRKWHEVKTTFQIALLEHEQRMKSLNNSIRKSTLQKHLKI